MNSSVRWLLALVLALVFAVQAQAEAESCLDKNNTALVWLDKMSRSVEQVSYHGVITLQRGDDMQVMQVSHQVHDGDSAENLIRLTGQGAQIKRGAHPVNCIHPGQQLLRLGEELRSSQCSIAKNYRFTVTDGDRVAGRESVRIDIAPRDIYRLGYVLFLDRETGLLLKTRMMGSGETVLEKFQFANLSYDTEPPGISGVDVIHEVQHPPGAQVPDEEGLTKPWDVTWVPRGFFATDAPWKMPSRRTYTDGLAVFSVFLESLDVEIRPGDGLARSGGTISYTRGMRLDGEPVLITVIGEVPSNTARVVADSIRWSH
jgi:sigma-E factor negative regulatory protein RseB